VCRNHHFAQSPSGTETNNEADLQRNIQDNALHVSIYSNQTMELRLYTRSALSVTRAQSVYHLSRTSSMRFSKLS